MKKLYKVNQFTAAEWDAIEYDWNEHEDEIVIIEKKDAYCMDITANGKRLVPILRKIEEAMTAAGLAGDNGIYAGWFGEWANNLTDRRDRKYFIWNYSGQSDRERGCWSYSWGIEQIDEDRWYIFLNIAKPQTTTTEEEAETMTREELYTAITAAGVALHPCNAAEAAPEGEAAIYYLTTEELTGIYADITEEQTTDTDTEEEEEEETMFNNYVEAVTEDAAQYIRDNYTAEELAEKLADREEFAEELNDAMWVADEVTGNGSGSYTFNRMKAREFVLADIDTVQEALREFCTEADTIAEKFLGNDWEYFDVTARCYVLGQAIDAALDIIEAETAAA